ncbi:ATP-dependent DNA helicase Hel308 [uncultured archaeon]|nr:ATP-dependent DNA helicase Hel308 [uncultured archaeon]
MLDDFNPKRFTQPAQKPEYKEVELGEVAKSVFSARGIDKLYKHQAEGIRLAREGKNIVVVAPTASGKSEIYMNAMIEAAQRGENSLIIFPTKALSRDQLKRFEPFALFGIRAEVYDGDTPQSKRERIRKSPPQVLITNFDMLHFILLNNGLFHAFLEKLRLVVVDELHTYTGVFGGHVSNIIWRLRRVMEKKHKAKLGFICTSATIGNARSFAALIFGEEFEEVDGEGAPSGEFEHMLVCPEGESYTTASLRIAEELEKKSLIFANSHAVVERLGLMGKRMGLNLSVYRAGLDYDKRREIERNFKEGGVRILATTSALELGMDIGDVDAVILAGFPGSITKVRQRIGRAGRKGQRAYGVYVARDNPLDQYYVENSEEYLHGEPESCFANPNNENLVKLHLLSAAKDALLSENELNGREAEAESLIESGLLKKLGKFYVPTPAGTRLVRSLSIRGAGKSIRIVDSDLEKQIGEREFPMAINELFEGAVYLHGGEAYMSESLELEYGVAKVRKVGQELDFYTQALSIKEADVLEETKARDALGYPLSFGKVHVKTTVHGFAVKETFSGRKMGEHSFPDPYVYDFNTYGIWIDLDSIAERVRNFGDGLHGFEHVFIAMIPALTGADSKELGGLSYPSGRMYVYDGVPEGNGVTNVVFGKFEKIARMAHERLQSCKCESGCPKCVLDPMCGNDNHFLDKAAAKEISGEFATE